MNRRTFVKLTGITLISTQTLANIDEPLKWTPWRKQIPKVGQKIILLAKYRPFTTSMGKKFDLYTITVGNRITTKNISCRMAGNSPSIAIKQEFRICSVYYHNNSLLFYYPKMNSYSLEEIKKLKWVKITLPYKEMVEFRYNIALYFMTDNIYWLPALNKLPKILPTIPKYDYSTK